MGPLGIASTVLKLVSFLGKSDSGAASSSASSGEAFSSSLAARVAELRAGGDSALSSLAGGRAGNVDFLTAAGAAEPISLLNIGGKRPGLSAFGRNPSLFDPESGYRMMSGINTREVAYKAQYAELGGMGDAVAAMREAGQSLAASSAEGGGAAVRTALQSFATRYNEWVARFDDTVAPDGVLAGTQAARVALYELRQSIEDGFNGAANGIHGLRDLGFSIDPTTGLASLDTEKFDAVVARNRDGAVAAVEQFAANFAHSAELLVAKGNFIPNQLANLDRVIDYLADQRPSLQAEFGLGDPARPSAAVAQALAAYQRMSRG